MKKNIPLSLIFFLLLFISCKKENTASVINTPLPAGKTLASGNFISNAHSSSGTVKIIMGDNGKIFMAFENFKTDNGPDLRIWISPDNSAGTYLEIGRLTAVSGNFSYELTASVNYTTNNHVLIWCKDFSVLFGHAILQ
jgi:Electron transfer DM13